jgi:hypothetical protein
MTKMLEFTLVSGLSRREVGGKRVVATMVKM